MRIKSCLRASANSMNGFHLLLVGLFLFCLLIAFAPVAAGQMSEKVLYRFGGNSSGAISNVIRDSAGNFYGTTQLGGTGNGAPGAVFKVDPTGKETILYSFQGNPIQASDGAQPMAGLVMDAAGNLYGTTPFGGGPKGNGTVFKVDPADNYTNLVVYNTFLGPSGGVPEGGLLLDSAGNLYGTTYSGGNFNFGVVFKTNTSGSSYTALYNFAGPGADGANPRATLVLDAAGNLYGTTLNGGTDGKGIVFKLDPTGKETVLHSFTGRNGDGASPEGALAIDQAGNLYGTTLNGGTNGKGVVFKLDSAGNETVLHSFIGNGDGANPDGGLIRDNAGNLYGTTLYGGTTGNGTVFKVSSTGLETVVHSFTGTNGDGSQPQASLTLDAAGNLYGTTEDGGASGGGTIFKLDSAANETVLFSFAGLNGDGTAPQSELVMDSAGKLYGTTPSGGATIGNCNQCGTVFKVDPTTGNETVFYRFTQTNGDGARPQSGLIQDSAGNFYGTTYDGGAGGSPTLVGFLGTVFKLDPAGNETTLYSFTSTNGDGQNPVGGLVRDSADNLYGTTVTGGSGFGTFGTVFKLDPTGLETVLHSFTGLNRDDYPEAALILDSAGNLYGTASDNNNGTGTVFKVTPAGTETVLHAFGASGDGSNPRDALIMDAKGNLYGTTYSGGVTTGNCGFTFGCGVVFKVDPQANETVLYAFTGTNGDGANPQDPVIMDSAGNLYGTTSKGGAFSSGTVFKLDPAGHETVLYSFIGTKVGTTGDGAGPLGGLIMDSAGKLYGTTSGGGQSTARCPLGCGTVFVLEPGGATTTTLTSSLNPSANGQPVTFTATVKAQSSGTPTGIVAFLDGGTSIGTGSLNASAQATFTITSLAQGTHSIVAQYGGDNTFAGSASSPLSQQVLAQLQSITVSPNPASVAVGKTLQFMATGHYADGSTRNLTTSVTWSSDHKTVTISNSPGSQGLATGVEVEKGVIITASQGTISGTAQLNVTPH